jgi:hypothetical protein
MSAPVSDCSNSPRGIKKHTSIIRRVVSKARNCARSIRATTKRILARAFYSLPGLSGRNPRRRITTIEQECERIVEIPGVGKMWPSAWQVPVSPPHFAQREAPFCLDDRELGRFREGVRRHQGGEHCDIPPVTVAGLPNGKVFSKDFLVLTAEHRLLFESALCRTDILEANGFLDWLSGPQPTAYRDVGFLLAQNSPQAYYHWIVEMLPKLELLDRIPDSHAIPLIVGADMNKFQRDSLQMLGVQEERLLKFDETCWGFNQLYFPMLPGPTGCPSPRAIEWLRGRLLPRATPPPTKSRRIYLTRRDVPKRRVLNEPEVSHFLKRHGFESICPGDLSFAQQVGLFRDAKVVVAPHGAGATNMIFAAEGAVLIELFGSNYVNGCFWAIANARNQKYAFLTEETNILDYTVSVERLERLLSAISVI